MYDRIFSVDASSFDTLALEIFRQQYNEIDFYRTYCDAFNKTPSSINAVQQIPFLPIEFFKSNEIIAKEKAPQKIFESSGTTGTISSKHHIADLSLYERSALTGFHRFYGNPEDYVFLALLPSYLERDNSSLVYMTNMLMKISSRKENGFYLNEFEKLKATLAGLKAIKQKTILLGVTFGLLDFAEQHAINFPELLIMETGGMKGRREEMTREEVHERLKSAFGVKQIHSEYGMTELLSQAYSKGDGVFHCPPWMKILTRDVYDPLQTNTTGTPGTINIIDLANLHSCSFIATGDVGKVNKNGSFEVLGRMDSAEVRGCNLMIA